MRVVFKQDKEGRVSAHDADTGIYLGEIETMGEKIQEETKQ